MFTKDKKQPAFTDEDLMPFGKHKGEHLKDVPGEYLRWLYEDADNPLSDFIGRNLEGKPDYLCQKIMLANYIFNSWDAL